MATRPGVIAKPLILEHRIPTPGSKPYIITGPDEALWFVESVGKAIGRMDLQGNAVAFPLPRPGASPRGIALAPNGDFWITENAVNMVARMSPTGEILAEYPLPTKQSGPRAVIVIPDGRVFFSSMTRARSARSFRRNDSQIKGPSTSAEAFPIKKEDSRNEEKGTFSARIFNKSRRRRYPGPYAGRREIGCRCLPARCGRPVPGLAGLCSSQQVLAKSSGGASMQ
jgi:streptogramin lyase